ncbi:MAG: DUF288 domain-containing protein [Symploca sp. SIO2D2]|nr:DUF288 domain-containing protein [Symploca sp. SIO2D2]
MNSNTYIVITSINAPNKAMKMFADGAQKYGAKFLVVGDTKSPQDFWLENSEYFSVDDQINEFDSMGRKCPTGHYARKNIGYLIAIKRGAKVIIDTDDDNLPYDSFWETRSIQTKARIISKKGWVNAYRFFTKEKIWPRGLPLDEIAMSDESDEPLVRETVFAPIKQGLANENPDVDALFRLTHDLPLNFSDECDLALMPGAWCPFNSQNTTWFQEAFPLLYLPAYCSFRMTDIWRSFVAQRIAAENDWPITFHKSTVWQERNDHDLMKDFAEEVPGYLHNSAIRDALESTQLKKGESHLVHNLLKCYATLVDNKWIGENELQLLEQWTDELQSISGS